MGKRDHTVEIWTRNGDKQTRQVTAKEAAELENEPFREESNVSRVRVQPPRGES